MFCLDYFRNYRIYAFVLKVNVAFDRHFDPLKFGGGARPRLIVSCRYKCVCHALIMHESKACSNVEEPR